MAEATTIARPYAQAVFELARDDKRFTEWSGALSVLSAIAGSDDVKAMIGNPKVTNEQLVDLFVSVAGDKLDNQGKNLVKVLAENDRLIVLPEIAQGFESLRAEEEKTIKAELVSSQEVSDAQKNALSEALKKRLGRNIELTCRIDESLIGGAVIRAGDLVIDGSISGQLERLSSELTH
jgi:F-type H+-transporting ATPase subunit delta